MHWTTSTRRIFNTAVTCLQKQFSKVDTLPYYGLHILRKKSFTQLLTHLQINRKKIMSHVRVRLDKRSSFFFKQHSGFEYQRKG